MPGAAEGPVGHRKAGRLDDMGLHAEAGASPQHRAGILGDVGLVEGEPQRLAYMECYSDRAKPL